MELVSPSIPRAAIEPLCMRGFGADNPLLLVYPASAAFFWVNYLCILPALSRLIIPRRHAAFDLLNERCWRQNINSLLHTAFASVCLTIVLVSDVGLRTDRLGATYNWLLYLDISLSLGYFSFVLPMVDLMCPRENLFLKR